MSNPLFRMDERAGDIARRVCTVMYGITILMLAAVLLYRQFVLNQSVEAFKDIANILTLNVILTPCAIGFRGGLTVRKVRPLTLIAVYGVFVLLGFGFTVFKYSVLLNQPLSTDMMLAKLLIVSSICAAIVAVYAFFAYFGTRKIDREIE